MKRFCILFNTFETIVFEIHTDFVRIVRNVKDFVDVPTFLVCEMYLLLGSSLLDFDIEVLTHESFYKIPKYHFKDLMMTLMNITFIDTKTEVKEICQQYQH